MPKAYSYLRFSTPDQMRGDSFRRQSSLAAAYVAKHGLELDSSLTFHDLGVSAFRGRNVETGHLGTFLEAVRTGLVPRGSFLLVESLDRISRLKARRATRVLEDIVEEGVTVVTLVDGKAYNAESLDDDPMAFMWAFLVFMRAHEESETKSRRLKAAWEGKRAKATEKPLTSRGPAWLSLEDEEWIVREDRAAVVRRIFDMAAAGIGQNRIAETLNREQVPPFGDSTRKAAQHWHRSYVVKLLDNPAVVGTFVPHVTDYSEGKRTRLPRDPVEGYYPAVVAPDVWDRVRALGVETRAPLRGRHAKGVIRNILGGLAGCPECGGTMTRVTKGSRSKAGKPYLVCSKAKAGAGCLYRAVRCEDVERALLENAGYLTATAPSPSNTLTERLQGAEAGIGALEDELDNLLSVLARDPSPAIRERVRQTETFLDGLRAEARELADQVSASYGPLVQARLDRLRELLEADPLDVAAANVALRQALSRVVVDYRTGMLSLEWLHGGMSSTSFMWGDARAGHPR